MKIPRAVVVAFVVSIASTGWVACIGGGEVPEGDAASGADSDEACAGCIHEASGECLDGTLDEACGTDGEQCVVCGEGEECSEQGECVQKDCSPSNCDTCCKDGECVSEISDDACGSGGEQCTSCGGRAKCGSDGSCETCDGCWNGDECITEVGKENCGKDGNSCSTCGSDQICKNGSCLEKTAQTCADSCDGYCSGSECISMTEVSDDQCGTDGEACQACGPGKSCAEPGVCSLQEGSKWDVVGVSATIDKETVEGDPSFTGPKSNPDPWLQVEVGDTKGRTSKKEDTYEPFWDEVTVSGQTASTLQSSTTYHLWDDDPLGKDAIVKDCSPEFSEEDFGSGTVEHSCQGGKHDDNKATIEFRLVPSSE